jgi:protein-S-isoprenylcysteine O-methyltransferase Ste14
MTQKQTAVVLFALSGAAVVVLSIASQAQMPIPTLYAKWIGLGLVAMGIALAGLAWLTAGAVFQGGVDPISDRLVTQGPYGIVRHPVYLGFTVAFIGVALAARSYVGLVAIVLGFIPAAIHRARLEERALARLYGDTWREYAATTAFMLPGVW